MRIEPLDTSHRDWLRQILTLEWGLPIVSTSGVHDPTRLPGFVAQASDRLVGAVTYRATDLECEVVTLNSLEPRSGVGTALLAAVKVVADRNGLRLWLITTDDNPNALQFYEHRGMSRRAVHPNFVDSVRAHKAPTPEGEWGFRDAFELSY